MRLRNTIALTVLPFTLATTGSRAKDALATTDQQADANKQTAAASAFIAQVTKDTRLGNADRIARLVVGLEKELAHPAPTLTVQGSVESGPYKVNYSKGIQVYYVAALGNLRDTKSLQDAANKARSEAVRDVLLITIGSTFVQQPDPIQKAVYPRIVELVQANTDETSQFPYEQAILALSFASRYPEYSSRVIPLLSNIVTRSRTSADGEPVDTMDTTARFAKDALRFWGYTVIRDCNSHLQVVRKAPAAKPAASK